MTGLDLRPDTTTVEPTRMRRNDVIAVQLWFPPDYDLDTDALVCEVKDVPAGTVAAIWVFELDPDPGDIDADLEAAGVTDEHTAVLWTCDAADLVGSYRYDVQDQSGNTLFGANLYVDPDVSEETGS